MLTASSESLAGLTAVHNWLSQRLPMGQSLASARLFIVLCNAAAKGIPTNLQSLVDSKVLPGGAAGAELLAAYVQAGLLVQHATGPGPDQVELQATDRLHELVASYERFHNGLWVSRDRFRRHLYIRGVDTAVSDLVQQLFDEFLDCDFIHGYGSGCVKVSHLLVEALRRKGHPARVLPCWARMSIPRVAANYALGKADPQVQPGQIDAHVVCVLDDGVLLDFGLGVARRSFASLVPWAVAVPMNPSLGGPVLAAVRFESGLEIEWQRQGFGETVYDEIARVEREVPRLFAPYLARASARSA